MSETEEQKVERLGRVLHDRMEQLDPTGSSWEECDEEEKNFYRYSVETILQHLEG